MKPVHKKIGFAAIGLGAVAAAAWAAAPEQKQQRNTPPNWSWEIRDGKPVPRVNRVTHADGSWTEEYRLGNCTVRREGRAGEIRETRKCD